MRKISFSNLSSGQIGQLFQSLDIHLEEANRADDEYEEVPYQAECSQNFENHWKGSILLCEVHIIVPWNTKLTLVAWCFLARSLK